MLSTDEVYHATLFVQAYKEALDTVEYLRRSHRFVDR